MEATDQMLRPLLVEAGADPATAAALPPSASFADSGIPGAVAGAFGELLSRRFGAPPPGAGGSPDSLDGWIAALDRVDDATAKAAALARIAAGSDGLPPGLSYALDRMRPEDAPGVARLFHEIYGGDYPVIDYYIPERLLDLNRQGRVLTVVARLPTGHIAGHIAFYRSSPPNPGVFEQGQLLVSRAYRNSTMAFRLLARINEISHTMDQAQAFFGEAVCTHLVTQKSVSRQGYSECGLELSLMPAASYAREGASGRVTCLLGARVDRDRRQPLFLPEAYRREAAIILSGFSLDRDIRYAATDAPEFETSEMTDRTFDFAQVRRVQVAAVGRDFPARLEAVDAAARQDALAVVQVYLDAGRPGVAFAVEALRRRGYVFGGLIPLWFGTDALMLQKPAAPPDFASINLHAARARDLLARIRAEWERAHGPA